jgi:dTDP-4-dehydrorhamnose 3,5-epimerase-like enzyme
MSIEFSKKLNARETPIPGVVLYDLPVHGDNRGWFKENWQREKMVSLGLPDFRPVQNNISFNEKAGTTRGFMPSRGTSSSPLPPGAFSAPG